MIGGPLEESDAGDLHITGTGTAPASTSGGSSEQLESQFILFDGSEEQVDGRDIIVTLLDETWAIVFLLLGLALWLGRGS